jgi:RNA polymerase sigma-70 factor (ECF subfamily)
MDYSDQDLVDGLRSGNLEAFHFLFEKHYKGMVAYGMRILQDMEIARDVVQDVFYYIWDKKDTLVITRSIDSYLFRSVHNACINHMKREETRDNYTREFLAGVHDGYDYRASPNGGLDYLSEKNLNAEIEKAIEELPEQCRKIFRLSRFKGLRNKEIADIYAISTRTVETQIYRALKVLRKKLRHHLSVALLLFTTLFY